MKEIRMSLTRFKRTFWRTMKRVRKENLAVILTDRGKDVAVIVPYSEYWKVIDDEQIGTIDGYL